VSVDGVRQDFVIESPPLNRQGSTLNQSAGELRVELALSGAWAEATASGARLTLEGSRRALAYSRLRVADATGRELTARLEVLSPDRLAVSVADANAIYPVRIDPTFSDADWVSLNPGLPGANNQVSAIVVDGTGNVYVGGSFTFIGAVPANYIAKWDGSAWSALGSGMSGTVNALAVSGTDLYAGGNFTTAGGVTVNGIAKWHGSAWSALGSGMGGTYPYVYGLAASGTNLYAGGVFSTAGGVPANYIAKWDGGTWSALSSGISGSSYCCVRALAVIGTDLYAGGAFTNAGSVLANGIAKWDGSTWSALGSGTGGSSPYVNAMAASGTNLYAGGDFTMAGGVSANHIAKWDGSAWSALGSGIGESWESIITLSAWRTDLYAGGSFTTAGGVAANYIAKPAWLIDSSGYHGLWCPGTFRPKHAHPLMGLESISQADCQMGRQRLVGLAPGTGQLCLGAGGGRDQSVRWRMVRRARGGWLDGRPHRQMGRQRLVGLGLGDGQRSRCAGGERDRCLRGGGTSPRQAGCRSTSSPNGTAVPGQLWAPGWTTKSMRWR
jgi:hypothetical protein